MPLKIAHQVLRSELWVGLGDTEGLVFPPTVGCRAELCRDDLTWPDIAKEHTLVAAHISPVLLAVSPVTSQPASRSDGGQRSCKLLLL